MEHEPVNAISGKTSRSKSPAEKGFRSVFARAMLAARAPSWGENCRVARSIFGGLGGGGGEERKRKEKKRPAGGGGGVSLV